MTHKILLGLFIFPVLCFSQEANDETKIDEEIQYAISLAQQATLNRPANFPKVFTNRPEVPDRTSLPGLPTPVLVVPPGSSPVFDAEYEMKKAEYDAEMAALLRERIEYLKNERQKGKSSEFGGTFSEFEKQQEAKVEALKDKKKELKELKSKARN